MCVCLHFIMCSSGHLGGPVYVAVGPLFVECIISAELYGNVMSRIHYFSRRSSASNHLYFYGNPYFPSMSKKKGKREKKPMWPPDL